MPKKPRITGKPYEELIYKIYQELAPYADVRLNDKILGVSSKIEREIDISLRFKFGGVHEILIIIQAKDHKKPADIKILGEFDSVISDVGASKGILICSSGFSKTAKTYAENKKIEICSAYDAMNLDWKSEIEIPAIKIKIIAASRIRNNIYISEGAPGQTMYFYFETINDEGKKTTVDEDLIHKIAEGKLESKPGVYSYLLPKPLRVTFSKFGKEEVEIVNYETEISYKITHRHYFKFLKPDDYRGIKNYMTKEFTPSHIQIHGTKDLINDSEWKYVEEVEKIPYYNNCIFVEQFSLLNTSSTIKYDGFRAVWVKDGKQKDALRDT